MEKGENQHILGICLGASTVSMVHVAAGRQAGSGRPEIRRTAVLPHEGNPRKALDRALASMDPGGFDRIVATGRRFRDFVNFTSIPEPWAVEYAYRHVKPPFADCPAIVSAGGETFMVYVLDRLGQIANVITGNKCASGTGEFFLQQLRRMNVTLDEAAAWAADAPPHPVSGRCSVFCKSDCTHATNKGVPKANVTAGLCRMMADKILELLKKVERRNIMITGGTTANRMMMAHLERHIPGLIVPREAPYFEALGAALWALANDAGKFVNNGLWFSANLGIYDTLPPLTEFQDMVEFKSMDKCAPAPGDVCTLGLDVGSTTTKAVLLRNQDHALLASVYLRTNGDPVGASRQCYAAISRQLSESLDPSDIRITGLGVCGSGRQIAGLHALTEGVINEIIAHAAAAVHFDPQVDTILEIGGQDAKYTYIVNSVPADYAMNEACSAGTGSFLEESALESLGVAMTDIADIALEARKPPNFNDQCAAFIASDIKNAIHEGARHEDIVGGLVYSICMNYANRVKGNRPIGRKVFMQGGVCYNRAVPMAMAGLIGKPIVVPPEPGLMGAFGVALEVKKRTDLGLLEKQDFRLDALAGRDVVYKTPFTCRGGKEKCDRRCRIAVIDIEGVTYPFGGACNRYYNLRRSLRYDVRSLDMVRERQDTLFQTFAPPRHAGASRGRIGINRSFMTHTYYPLYAHFFAELGFEAVLPETPSRTGIDRRNAAFCYPAELAHGYFHALLSEDAHLDYIFLPYFKALPTQITQTSSQVCPIVQSETFCLQSTFKADISRLKKHGTRLLAPLLDLTQGDRAAKKPLIETARMMGIDGVTASRAFDRAIGRQIQCMARIRAMGRKAMARLAENPEQFAVVLFGRPYNAFAEEAHMGIPHKLASRGVPVIPWDGLDLDAEESKHHMYWGVGQRLMKAARRVKAHPQLFGTYITNFSCGPDSFLIGYFRDIMGRKPSLTLELDSHTADAGLETRIEAFLDIVAAYRQIGPGRETASGRAFRPAALAARNGAVEITTAAGRRVPLLHPDVTILLPSMGKISTESLNAVFQGAGHRSVAHPPADEAVLKLGRANTSCKECLPLILTTGSLLNYVRNIKRPEEIVVYFMPTTSGPCRFGQYSVFMNDLIRKMEIPDTVLYSLTSENTYAGLGNSFERRAWWAVVVSDVMEDIRSMLLTNALDRESAMAAFGDAWRRILDALGKGDFAQLLRHLESAALRLREIPLKRPPGEVPVIALIGEIFVRRDGISRRHLMEHLAEKGFAVRCAPIAEWLYYLDVLALRGLTGEVFSLKKKLGVYTKQRFKSLFETKIKSKLALSGLVSHHPVDIRSVLDIGGRYISPTLGGEAILTVGSAMAEVAVHACGVISIGPFGCMPTRISEAILTESMNRGEKLAVEGGTRHMETLLADMDELPFLSIESDGSPFPQLIHAKLEAFCLRSERLHHRMRENSLWRTDRKRTAHGI